VSQALPATAGHWPWATFLVNIAAAFVLGWTTTRLQERLPVSSYGRPFVGTGFCGAMSTFATMQLELLQMLDGGRAGLALAYAAVSFVVGFGAMWLATGLARR
jgi:CrcB protein